MELNAGVHAHAGARTRSEPGNVKAAPHRDLSRTTCWLAGISILIALGARLGVDWDSPLWFDEVYTGIIAAQPSFSGFVDDALNELGGPLYYGVVWLWAKIAGLSDAALRMPSVLFALATPLAILLWGHSHRPTRLLWAALCSLWLPIFDFATEARSYSLLFLLACLQTIAFRRALLRPTFATMLGWSAATSAMLLTHYYAFILAACQGIVFLAFRRNAIVPGLKSSFMFLPVLLWMVLHAPFLAEVSAAPPWHPTLGWGNVKALPYMLLGWDFRIASALLLMVGATSALDLLRFVRTRHAEYELVDVVAAGAGVAAIAIVFGMGFLRPSFSDRYLLQYMPAVLLGLAVWTVRWGRSWRYAPTGLVALFLGLFLANMAWRLTTAYSSPRWSLSWDRSTAAITGSGAKRLVFLLDNPVTAAGSFEQYSRVAGFFARRRNADLVVEAVALGGKAPDTDPNRELVRIASRSPKAGIIWMYNSGVKGTLAARFPPDPQALSDWRCSNFSRGDGPTVMLTCIPLEQLRDK